MSFLTNLDRSNILARQGHRLLQVGVGFLLFTSFWGFLFPYLASPPLGLSAHKLMSLTAVLFLALGAHLAENSILAE